VPSILPTPQKRWSVATLVSALSGTDATNQKDLILQIKNQRKTFGHVVMGSSDGTTGAIDGVDRWSSTASLPDGVDWPWMLLKQPGSGAEDLVSYQAFGQTNWRWEQSPGGLFTGGSASTLPTATDSSGSLYGGINGSIFFGGGGHTAHPYICNMWVSSDLKCCRQTFWYNGNPFGNVVFDAIDDPSAGISPCIAFVDKFNSSDPAADNQIGYLQNYCYSLSSGIAKGWGPSGRLNMYGSATGTYSGGFRSMVGQLAGKNKVTGTYRNDESRCGLYEPYVNSDGGYHGLLFDHWWVQERSINANFNSGDTLPLDGSKQFVIIGDFMWPWNGGAFRTA
jgi:hypothetical protein